MWSCSLTATFALPVAADDAVPRDAYIENNGVTVRCPGIDVDATFELDGVVYTRRDRAGVDTIVADSSRWGELSRVCTTGVDDLSSLFRNQTTFNVDISSWDTGSVTTMYQMWVSNSTDVRSYALWRSLSLSASLAC